MESKPYIAIMRGDAVDLDCEGVGGLSVSIRDLCSLCKIGYARQGARIQGDNIEIDPPRLGGEGASIPIEAVFRFYQR